MLKKYGADFNAKASEGNTPMHIASSRNVIVSIAYFRGTGAANIDAKNDDGQTPLHCACISGATDAVKYLSIWSKAVND